MNILKRLKYSCIWDQETIIFAYTGLDTIRSNALLVRQSSFCLIQIVYASISNIGADVALYTPVIILFTWWWMFIRCLRWVLLCFFSPCGVYQIQHILINWGITTDYSIYCILGNFALQTNLARSIKPPILFSALVLLVITYLF